MLPSLPNHPNHMVLFCGPNLPARMVHVREIFRRVLPSDLVEAADKDPVQIFPTIPCACLSWSLVASALYTSPTQNLYNNKGSPHGSCADLQCEILSFDFLRRDPLSVLSKISWAGPLERSSQEVLRSFCKGFPRKDPVEILTVTDSFNLTGISFPELSTETLVKFQRSCAGPL